MSKQGEKTIVNLVNYIQSFVHFIDKKGLDVKNTASNLSSGQYPPEVFRFMEDVRSLSKEYYSFLGIMNQKGWWNRTVLGSSISQMAEKDILICLRAIIDRESRFKGFLLQYLKDGVIVRLLQRIIEIKKPFYNMTLDELLSIETSSFNFVDEQLHYITLTRKMEHKFSICCDIIYEEYHRLFEDDEVQKRIDRYFKMTLKELVKLTELRHLFQYNDKMRMSLFYKIQNNPEELNKLDISEMLDEEFIAFYDSYKCALKKNLKISTSR